MVTTRRQSRGLQNGDDLAIRSRQSPDGKILSDGTSHGTIDQDRSPKRRKTGRPSAVPAADDEAGQDTGDRDGRISEGQSKAQESLSVQKQDSGSGTSLIADERQNAPKRGAGDTITVLGPTEERPPIEERARGKELPLSNDLNNESSKSIGSSRAELKHKRFGSEEPEPLPEVDDHQSRNSAMLQEQSSGVGSEDEDQDEGPEEVNTSLKNHLESLRPLPQVKRKAKKRKRTDEAIADRPTGRDYDETHNSNHGDKSVEGDSDYMDNIADGVTQVQQLVSPGLHRPQTSSTDPSFITAVEELPSRLQLSSPPAASMSIANHLTFDDDVAQLHKPLNPAKRLSSSSIIATNKHKKDIVIPSQNLTIRHLDNNNNKTILPSFSASPTMNRGSLPLKVNSHSRNTREQLLHRRKGKNASNHNTLGFRGFPKVRSKGFLVK